MECVPASREEAYGDCMDSDRRHIQDLMLQSRVTMFEARLDALRERAESPEVTAAIVSMERRLTRYRKDLMTFRASTTDR